MMRFVAIVSGITLTLSLTAISRGDEPAHYEGRTLDEWRQVMKSLEPASPAASDVVPGLIAVCRSSDVPDATRAQAAYLLGRIGAAAADAVPVLSELLRAQGESEGEGTARWAAKALGLFGAEAATATPDLILLVTDEDAPTSVRLVAAEALGSIGGAHPDAIPTLMQLAAGEEQGGDVSFDDQQIRAAAVDGLAVVGPPAGAAVPLLIRLTRDDLGDLRKRGAMALGAMGSSAAVATEALVDLVLFDDLQEVRDAAATALGLIGEAGQLALAQLLTDEDTAVRRQAASAFAVVERLTDASREALGAALGDADVDVRLAAAESLHKGGDDLSALVPVVLSALAEANRQPRMRAYRLIVKMRSQASVLLPELRVLERDDRPFVREAARKAIAELMEPGSSGEE